MEQPLTIERLLRETLKEKRARAGRTGGRTTAIRHPRTREYMSTLGKLGGRPRLPTIQELMR
jgi:hypothetical protein